MKNEKYLGYEPAGRVNLFQQFTVIPVRPMGIFFAAKASAQNGARYWVPAFAGTTVASFSFQVLVEKWKYPMSKA